MSLYHLVYQIGLVMSSDGLAFNLTLPTPLADGTTVITITITDSLGHVYQPAFTFIVHCKPLFSHYLALKTSPIITLLSY
jgi:hypothetical protein